MSPLRSDASLEGRRVEIDRRPLAVVLLSRLRRQAWLLVLGVAFAALLHVDPPDGLTGAGWATLCVFALCATLWATSLLPTAITSLLAIALVPMLDILPARETYAYFGSKVVFFILGAFMLSAALIATGLSRRIATSFVRRFGGTPQRLVMAVFLLCAAGSTLMSEHAVAVMVFPIVSDLAAAMKLRRPASPMGRALFFALMWGCIVGGTLTVLGGGRGPLAIGILEEATAEAHTIGFTQYMLMSAPLVAAMMLVAGLLLRRLFEPEVAGTAEALAVLEAQLHEMGKVTPRELVVGLVVVITVALWAFAGTTLGLANIALVSMAALFALGALGWEDVQRHVNWGLVVMYGGAICLGGVMERTGAAEWLTVHAVEGRELSPTVLMLALAAAAAVLTEFMSNSAVVAMMLPPALSLAETLGVDPRAMTMAVVLPTNFAFFLPIATPVTALAWSSGFLAPRPVGATGLLLNLAAWVGMAFLILAWWPLLGLA